jgi:mRNA-degrading endonuclease YafQ of YafQ-DinJ toxin-antitoxin module
MKPKGTFPHQFSKEVNKQTKNQKKKKGRKKAVLDFLMFQNCSTVTPALLHISSY